MNWWKLTMCWVFVAGFTWHYAEMKAPAQNREIASQYKFVPFYDASFKQ